MCKPSEWHVNTSYIIICKRQFQLCATIVIQQKYRLKTSLARVSVISLERNPKAGTWCIQSWVADPLHQEELDEVARASF